MNCDLTLKIGVRLHIIDEEERKLIELKKSSPYCLDLLKRNFDAIKEIKTAKENCQNTDALTTEYGCSSERDGGQDIDRQYVYKEVTPDLEEIKVIKAGKKR